MYENQFFEYTKLTISYQNDRFFEKKRCRSLYFALCLFYCQQIHYGFLTSVYVKLILSYIYLSAKYLRSLNAQYVHNNFRLNAY